MAGGAREWRWRETPVPVVVGDGRVGAWVAGCTLAAVGGERRAAVGAVVSGCTGWVVEWE